ncbi:MAG: monovalent cation/H(+) antiporter subunit G [Candidatus Saganbacteria bacterium]|nr:monovalent cation/H(+) antiporter subunit G [Candidatus Saganbacteria bacterium]
MTNVLGYIFIVIGLAFDLLGCLGLVRMPDMHTRLQAATKSLTLGTCSILFSMVIFHGIFSVMGLKSILCIIFIGLTAPTAAHALSRGAHLYGVKLWEKTVVDHYLEDRTAKK